MNSPRPPAANIARLNFIRRSRTAGLRLAQIRDVLALRDDGLSPCQEVRDLLERHLLSLDTRINELQTLRVTVAELRDSAETIDPGNCEPSDICLLL